MIDRACDELALLVFASLANTLKTNKTFVSNTDGDLEKEAVSETGTMTLGQVCMVIVKHAQWDIKTVTQKVRQTGIITVRQHK